MPKLSPQTVILNDGDLKLYKRARSKAWQATFNIDGHWVRISTKCRDLEEANRWDEDDVFDEWARPSIPLSIEAEMIVGTTNERLMHCRPTSLVLDDFLAFIDG